MSEMRLRVTMDGLEEVSRALEALTNLLQDFEQRLQQLVDALNALADALRNLVSAIPTSLPTIPQRANPAGANAPQGGNQPGGGANPQGSNAPNSPNRGGGRGRGIDWSSVLFSVLQGQFRVAFSKIFAGMARLGGTLAAIAGVLGLVVGVVLFLIDAFKKLAAAASGLYEGQMRLFHSLWSSDSQFAKFNGLARTLGIEPGAMASMARGTPGKGLMFEQLVMDIWRTYRTDKNLAYMKAEQFGLTELLDKGLGTMSYDELMRSFREGGGGSDIRDMAQTLRRLNELLYDLKIVFIRVLDFLTRFWGANLQPILDFLLGRNKSEKDSKQEKAAEKMERAADKLYRSAEIFAGREGVFGGGGRLRNAWPVAWSFYAYEQYYLDQTRSLGALRY